jgi:hypothetical protein
VTRARSKIAGAVAVAGALFAALVAVGTAGAARHDPGTATLRLIGNETATAQLDLGAPGPSLGDEIVFSGESRQAGFGGHPAVSPSGTRLSRRQGSPYPRGTAFTPAGP